MRCLPRPDLGGKLQVSPEKLGVDLKTGDQADPERLALLHP
jgi:hypothetical protein